MWLTEEQGVVDCGWHKNGAWIRDSRMASVENWKCACQHEGIAKIR